jgi:opacity protein-like surface antigen
MIGSRHVKLVRALSASVAAGALLLAASSGAGAQSAASEKPQASTKATKKKPAAASVPALAPTAAAPYAMVTKGPALLVTPAWTGLYAGVSFGPSTIKANTALTSPSVSTQNINLSTGALRTVTTVDNFNDASSGRGWGPLSDIYLGYNFRPGGNLVAGVQLEGTITNAKTQLQGALTSVSTTTTVTTPPGSTSTSTTVTNQIFEDSLAQRWAVSALGRLGLQLAPRDFAYVIGGYTRGGFEWDGRSFGLNGGTVGAGWEHEIAPSWTFKAEYRFTAFESKDLPRPSSSTAVQSDTFAGATTTAVINSTAATTDHVSGIALHALRFGITHYFDAAPGAAPAPMLTKAAPVVASPWEGSYAGVSYGPALITASTSTVVNSVTTRVTTSATGTVTTTTTNNNVVVAGSGNNTGAVSDIFLGYNFRLGGNVIAGVQAEATVAEVQTPLASSEAARSSATTVITPPGTTSTSSSTLAFNFIDAFAERWAVSALARIGVLIDPHDLVYGIGGYTYGGFDWSGRVFGLNGATVGAGWEHEIAPSWTLKAEYRYTAFQDKDLPRPLGLTQSQTSVSTTGAVSTTVVNQTGTIADHVSGVNLHALRFGITHYLNDVPPTPYAMPVKAPVLAGPVWTGVYGGVSFGAMSMHVKSDSVSNEVFIVNETVPGLAFTQVENINETFNTSGRHAGAVADVLVGYNAALGPKLIGGVQLEGSIAHGVVLANGSFAQTDTATAVNTPPGGAAGTETFTSTSSGNIRLDVQSRWMASALGRLGVLVDPLDLVYAIGGWSYGGFTTGAFTTGVHPFNLNGPTVGIGLEREVAPAWTLRAEYRYTHFLARDVTAAQTTVQTQTTATSTLASTDNFVETDRISVDMHTVRFGIAHYFATR